MFRLALARRIAEEHSSQQLNTEEMFSALESSRVDQTCVINEVWNSKPEAHLQDIQSSEDWYRFGRTLQTLTHTLITAFANHDECDV